MLCSLLSIFLLTAAVEEIENVDAPLIHSEDLPLAVDISPVIRFETDETGVFAVVTVQPSASSEEITTLPALEDVIEPEEPVAFFITSSFTDHSIKYTLTPIPPEGENH